MQWHAVPGFEHLLVHRQGKVSVFALHLPQEPLPCNIEEFASIARNLPEARAKRDLSNITCNSELGSVLQSKARVRAQQTGCGHDC